MDPHLSLFSASGSEVEIDYDNLLPTFSNSPNDFKLEVAFPDLNFFGNSLFLHDLDQIEIPPPSIASQAGLSYVESGNLSSDGFTIPLPTGTRPGADSSFDDSDFSDAVLKYINQTLPEEKPGMFYDPVGLKATVKSSYDVINESCPSSPNQPSLSFENRENFPSGMISGHDSNGSTTKLSNYLNDKWIANSGESNLCLSQASFAGESKQSSLQVSEPNPNSLTFNGEELVSELQGQSHLNSSESVLQFKKGLEEAREFQPEGDQFFLDLESNMLKREEASKVGKMEKENSPKNSENWPKSTSKENSPTSTRGRKNHEREDEDVYSDERRSNKQSAVYLDERELSEMFDKVLLHRGGQDGDRLFAGDGQLPDEACMKLQIKEEPQGSNKGKTRVKRQGNRTDSVDLRALLIQCAQSVSSDDRRTASELLKQIREHSSPIGDGSQRLAHYFANALEARLAGTGTGTETKVYLASLGFKKLSAFDLFKVHQVHFSACPFQKSSLFYANKMIFKVAEKAETLHIIDFGIRYGFQWPILIQNLSFLPGGPPKLRITGIELPQPGFRPTERIMETGRRLEEYCSRFNVPFEYNAIASYNWETIRIEDLKIDRDEVIAVNCMHRFKNLVDETVEATSPRDAVLGLIRKINPNIFVHSIVNGSYNTPFFTTRFREALFHYSALYDMYDTNISRENEERKMLEREFLGSKAMNVIACEGLDRVERPETYKQWQVRCLRAGFKQVPLDQTITEKFRRKLKACYDKDFFLDEDGNWILQGWKGRIVSASTSWVAA